VLAAISLFMVALAVVGPFAVRSWRINRVRTLLEEDGAQVRMKYRGPDPAKTIIPFAYDGLIHRALEDEFISITYGTPDGPRCHPDMALFDHVQGMESLYFYAADVADHELRHVSHLKGLRALCFADCPVGRESLGGLKGLRKLKSLTFYECLVSDGAVEALGELVNLEYLELYDCPLSGDGLAELAGLYRLKRLELGLSNVNSAGLRHLTGFPRLTRLGLQKCPLGGEALPLSLPALTHLSLWNSTADDATLAAFRNCTSIRKLDLTGTRITDAGLAHVSGLNKLKWLDLSGTEVTDAGMSHLTSLGRLHWLSLQETAVSDGAVASLGKVRSLRKLILDGEIVTAATLERIQQQLPTVEVLRTVEGSYGESYGIEQHASR
jgi:hypothetical protein